MRISEEDYQRLICQRGQQIPDAEPKQRTKYNAVLTECEGIKFQSKKEAHYFLDLKARMYIGEVKYFLRQVPFDLVGGVKYRVDFMEVWSDGSVHYIDVKGFRTQTYKIKRRMVEASYPIKIVEA